MKISFYVAFNTNTVNMWYSLHTRKHSKYRKA